MVYHSLDDPEHVDHCRLCRTEKLGKQTLKYAVNRQVRWPEAKSTPPNFEESAKHVSLDDAFSSIFQFMNVTCCYCKRFYRGYHDCKKVPDDFKHINRFHTKPKSNETKNITPTHNQQELKIMADPGTYAVTSGTWGKEMQQTHVVKLDRGQIVSLDFVV